MNNINIEIDNIRQQQSKKMINSIITYCQRKKCIVDSDVIERLKMELHGSFHMRDMHGCHKNGSGEAVGDSSKCQYKDDNICHSSTQSTNYNGQVYQKSNMTRDHPNQYSVNPFFEVITLAAFQKDWKNLREIHKKLKIIEYMKTLDNGTPMAKKKETMNRLIDLVKKKKLTNQHVTYNYDLCKIEHIDLTILNNIES